jgi:hypothetical protein
LPSEAASRGSPAARPCPQAAASTVGSLQCGRSGTNVRRWVGAEHLRKRLRIARQRCDANHALSRVGVFVQAGTDEQLVEHFVAK